MEGNLWISTLKNGVYVMPSNQLSVINSQNSALHTSTPAYLTSDGKGNIYCSQNNGYISIINSENGSVMKVIDVGIRKDCEMLQYDAASGKIFTTYDQLLEITPEEKIEKINPKLPHVKGISFDAYRNYIVADPTSLFVTSYNQRRRLAGDYISQLWLKNFSWETWDDTSKPNARYRIELNSQRTRTLYHDAKNKTIWVSFTNGIYYFQNAEKHQLFDEQGKEIVAYKFAAGPDGSIWAGKANHGLICIKDDKIILHLTTKNGLLSNFIKSVSTNHKGVWFFAETGVQYYDFEKKNIGSFTRADGLISSDVTDILAAGGKVWICTSRGIQFFPDNFELSSTTPPIAYITGFAIAEHDALLTDRFADWRWAGFSPQKLVRRTELSATDPS